MIILSSLDFLFLRHKLQYRDDISSVNYKHEYQCSGNIGSVGGTLRIVVTSNGSVLIPINDGKIINASKLSSTI